MKGYLPLIQKYSVAYMHDLAVYAKEELLFAQGFYLEIAEDFNFCCRLALLHLVFFFFFFYWSPCLSFCIIFDAISFNIDQFLSLNPVFGDCNIRHKSWLAYSGGTDRPGNINFDRLYDFSVTIPKC